MEDASTLAPAPAAMTIDPQAAPMLTIVYHADVSRVGERVPVDRVLEISRGVPAFVPTERPLEDRYLSRAAIVRIRALDDGWSIEPLMPGKVSIDGQPETAARTFDRAAIARGITLELAERVVLLMHLGGAVRATGSRYGFVGDSDAIERVRADIARVADLGVPVLVRGESGSGKELVARAIHAHGPRRERPFVAVNVAALPPAMAASELFGHVRGAFTGAHGDQDGVFARADGGVLFLDEIGETPPDVQPMLLRTLETGEITPLGGRTRRVDVRLLAATDADLEHQIAEGGFREALFHRLAGYQLVVPSLGNRRDDIGRLIAHFLRDELVATGDLGRLDRQKDRSSLWLPAALVARLIRHAWPGNVRQLRNAVRQLAIANRGAEVVRLDAPLERMLAAAPEPATTTPNEVPVRRDPKEIGDDELVAALRASGWRAPHAAERLGISRSTLYALIERSTRIRKARDIPPPELRRALDDCAGDLDRVAAALEVSRRALQLRLTELGWK